MASRTVSGVVSVLAAGVLLAAPAAAQSDTFTTDDRGFVGTEARCEEPTVAYAFGRTQRSLVAICTLDGGYEYRGVRLRDDALLTAAATKTDDGEFVAENGGVSYTFSAKELVIGAGQRVIRTEPMVAYVEPRLAAEG